jgi:hypothetical protein
VFSRPPDAYRDGRRVDLINRARLVRAHGWDDDRAVWSTGEVLGVAALLGITTYSPSSTRVCKRRGPAGRSMCGAWSTDRQMSTTTADKPAGGSSTQQVQCEGRGVMRHLKATRPQSGRAITGTCQVH